MAIIPELEQISKSAVMKREWTSDEDDTLTRYYNRVPIETLMKHLPGRTEGAIRVRISLMKNKKITEVPE